MGHTWLEKAGGASDEEEEAPVTFLASPVSPAYINARMRIRQADRFDRPRYHMRSDRQRQLSKRDRIVMGFHAAETQPGWPIIAWQGLKTW